MDLPRAGVGCGDAGTRVTVRDALADALMGTGGVVVLLILGQDRPQVRPVQDEDPVQEFTAQRTDQALADRVHPRRLHRGAHDRGAGGLEDGIEGRGEVRPAVTDQEPEVPEPFAEIHGQVAGLQYCPLAGRVGGDAAEVHPAAAMLDEHQHVQPGQRDSIHVQEIDSQDPGGLRAQELPPGRAVPARRRVDARSAQDLIHGGRRDRDAELGQLAVNTTVTPQRVLAREADGEPGDAPDRRRAPGPASSAGVVFPGGEPAAPGQQRRGRDREHLRPAAARDEPGERGEPGPVSGVVPYPAGVAAQHRVLVPEHQQLGALHPVPADHHDSQAEQPAHEQAGDLEQHLASQPSLHRLVGQKGRSTTRSSFRAAQDPRRAGRTGYNGCSADGVADP